MEEVIVVAGKKKCEWFMGSDCKNCNKNAVNNTPFCGTHDFVLGYTEEQKQKKRYCSNCKQFKFFSEDKKTCGCGTERSKKGNAKRKANNQPKTDARLAEEKKKQEEKQKLLDQGHKNCPGCNQARPADSFNGVSEKCEICRKKQKEADSKRTRVRDWSAEYKKNPELYQRKLESNKNRANQAN
ncbi:MAG: hypothetical protein Barrevirus22_2 [Barrevirus sp.]|uniref:Uncharacterized protein n=1 Tax=Barrevirus sp. TaxID=2487763 RepID=A0A3G4ZQR1_9VIRU|nr:MAG: hypothetical protein Barrevirus22_2 [Barrevirus sp.]